MRTKSLLLIACLVFYLYPVPSPLPATTAAVHADPARLPMEKALLVIDSSDFGEAPSSASHADHMRHLKIRALASQSRVLRFLEIERRLGRVRDYKRYWIANAVWIEAQKSLIEELSDYYEVSRVIPARDIHVQVGAAPSGTRSAEEGLSVMGADSLWKMDLTGLGEIVCIIDTGVDGTHPALADRWRGVQEGVNWSEAWFDPVGGTQFPVDQDDHGTFMAGLIAGRTGADTTGAAPDALWIAARAIGGSDFIADLLASLEWAYDPDGDPGTLEDVPDVVPFTWSFFGSCDDLLWEAIDNLEEAGIAVVTSVGGYGPGPGTVGSPSDRIESPVNAFSVGTVDGGIAGYPVASFSGRGPSSCDGETVKPEVVAPGVNVRSTVPGGGYAIWSGTSLSASYVAGGILLLAQAEVTQDIDSLKAALLESALDLGPAGEDNAYGTGLVNLPSALEELGGFTPVRIDLEPEYSTGEPGDTLKVDFLVVNVTSGEETFEAFLGVVPPVGNGFILNRRVVSLEPLASLGGQLPLRVPVKAPSGDYELIGLVARLSPFTVIDSDTITVRVMRK
jgi:hypothetical protein